MSYRWKPSKSARKEFAANMKDANYAADYYARKDAKKEKKRAGSKFDYASAGGEYIPTQHQHDQAFKFLCNSSLTEEQHISCERVMSGYSLQEKVHHDYIHVVNELIRANN